MKWKQALGSALAVTAVALSASADQDIKMYMGSECSIGSASHSTFEHVLQNTSGSTKWMSCPVVRDTNWDLGHVELISAGYLSSPRVEYRLRYQSGIVGWPAQNTVWLYNGNVEYTWDGLAVPDDATIGISANVFNNQKVYQYRVKEGG